jgi:glycine/D-amino acid oxidase-like deaminating enzyme
VAQKDFDQIIIGAGMAGLCCAGELVVQGQRPLLICETPEVGAMFRLKTLGESSRFFLQHTTWQLGWGGGWWYQLARQLNVPVKIHQGLSWALTVRGSGDIVPLALPGSASAFVEILTEAFDLPLDQPTRDEIERIMYEMLRLPYEELYELHRVPLAQWLAEQGADELVSALFLTFCGFPNDMTLDVAMQHCSVFGGIATLRIMLCNEGLLPVVYPNPREGLLIPMAKEVERRGGEVWRGKKVAQVLVDGGRVSGVAFQDGTEVRGSTVAIATGNGRIRKLLDPLPPELVEPLAYTDSIALYDFNTYFLLDRPLVQPANAGIASFDLNTMSVHHWIWPLTGVAPWTTEPGKQLVGTHFAYDAEGVAANGGAEAIYAGLLERTEELVPGFTAAVVDSVNYMSSPTGTAWMSPVTHGPKIPRTVGSVEGLWFVGDGSEPVRGIWSEAAASAGILGARAMCKVG